MRVIENGRLNLVATGVRRRPLNDLYHYLVMAPWGVYLVLLAGVYLFLNALFAVLYVAFGAGLGSSSPEAFADAFFFSVQTMSTIGYGTLSPGDTTANVLVAVESVVSLIGLAMATGLTFAKFSRPQSRIVFSKYAVRTTRDCVESLIFRVGNERLNTIMNAEMKAYYTKLDVTPEGESVRRFVPIDIERGRIPMFRLIWQGTHRIDERSPLHGVTADELEREEVEIIVAVSGTDADLGQPLQSVYSYNAEDIVWGRRLADMIDTLPDGRRSVDFRRFHSLSG